ncbi:nucleotide disphospho-sugar-binding domain-containing protein [Streptomyces sp. TLI_171]|uniref:glycosyltransferase n=1 Tax=Streptomyces sp. TLI_171 TaxID=1938859 RepID=UPI000C19AFFA|nr:nucleotide disphospho-sugar-binding domain-containing protein [Streptomyces sp. TLI_171]RKE21821.1 UDP:flavonoid glycosyltransferase YjiC (YdhE family) [Streptomyces sp. TLI_171]
MALFLLVTHGSDGDVLPFVGLGAALVRAGHRAVLLTHAPYRAAATAAGLGFEPIDDEAEFERVLADTPHLLHAAPHRAGWARFYRDNGLFEQIAAECRTLIRLHSPGETVLVGRHTSAVSVRFAAELLDAPAAWVALSPTQLLAVPVAAYLYGTELATGLHAVRTDLGLPPIPNWRTWFTTADAELALWPAWFDAAATPAPPRTTLTGFPLADSSAPALGATPPPAAPGGTGDGDMGTQPTDAPQRAEASPAAPAPAAVGDLASGDRRSAAAEGVFGGAFGADVRPVLATGGTGRMLAADYYPALLAAVERAGLPTVLVVRHRDLLPAVLPANVRWSPGLDFARAVPRAAAVVHHGGIGTLARVLAAGTPQVLMADGVDRPDNAARLTALGLARTVPADRWYGPELAAAITAAANDHGYRARAAAVAGDPVSGLDLAATRLAALLTRPTTSIATPAPIHDRLRNLPPTARADLRERLRHRLAPTPPESTPPGPGRTGRGATPARPDRAPEEAR